eukprot:CAMPEP_0197516944 /NCGR_PEP_ID=MMETSP1318-20131121/1899_1 /TAXON_ID=552666 /ORGANISM="Partenskyella glossopodia, Strain RCC365" /LENGTH=256 /DNA_ID=CAMNT_0043066107 /DNA_START=40 /DNA_END=806 /DNA_ORIENTATION=-
MAAGAPGLRHSPRAFCDIVLSWLLWVSHLLIGIFLFVREVFSWVSEAVGEAAETCSLRKLPNTVGLCVDSEDLGDLADIVRVLEVCASHGIRNFVLFDMEGKLVRGGRSIARQVSRTQKATVNSRVGTNDQFTHTSGKECRVDTRCSSSSSSTSDRKKAEKRHAGDMNEVSLSILCAKSAQHILCQSLRDYCRTQKSQQQRNNDFNLDNTHICKGDIIPPELIICVGKQMSVAGFPAWLLGSAEFVHMSSMKDPRR